MSAVPRLVIAAAHALGGADAARAMASGADTPDELVSRLHEAGWTAGRLRAFRDACRAEGGRWPLAVPDDIRAGIGPAQLHAWVGRCEALLALDAVEAGVRDHSRPLDREDLRLMAERPPHHGSVG